MYEHSAVHDHVAGWAPVRSGLHNAEVNLSFKDTSAQHRQQLAAAGTIQLTMGQQRLSPCLSAQSQPNSCLTSSWQQQRTRAGKAALAQQQQQQQQQAFYAAFLPAPSVDNVPPANRLVLGRPLDPVLDLGGSLLPPAAASMEATDGPSTSAVPAAVADHILAVGPTPADTPMLPVVPLSVAPDFPDTAVSSAMCLCAEDVDIPVDIARQAVLHVHAKFASELSQQPSADCTCLSKPLQELMVTAVKAVTDDASFHLLCGQTRSQTAQQQVQPQTLMR
ncbi:TPA: hypothetical protein ACH3X3_012620 [Trebouxia sp. C0006]